MRRTLASVLAGLALACSPQPAGGPAAAVAVPADVALRARILRMTDTRTADSALIDEALASGGSVARSAAALAVGQVRAVALAPRLRPLLAAPDTAVAANAAFALGLLRDTAGVDVLRSALDREDPVAIAAAWALGEIGEPSRASLELALGERFEFAAPPRGGAVRTRSAASTVALLLAAAKLRPVPARHIVPLLGAGRDTVAWAASYALTRQRVPEAVRAVLGMAEAPSAHVRAQVARGLAEPVVGDSIRTEAVAALHRLAGDPDPHVRINAARSLATFGPTVADALVTLARDGDANVRIAAAQGFATAAPDSTAPVWTDLWASDTTMMFRKSLLESAMRHGAIIPGAEPWQDAADWRYRAAIIDARAALPRPADRYRALTPFLGDADPRVRARAVGAMGGLADSVPAARPLIENALRDTSAITRAAALGALAPSARAGDWPLALAEYKGAYDERDDEVRRSALALLAAIWRRDSLNVDGARRAQLAELPPPREPSELAGIDTSGAFRSWRMLPRAPRPHGWYEDIVREWVTPSAAGRHRRAVIRTERGPIEIEMFGDDAPITAANFAALARSGYFRGTRFHRVVPNFVVQDGDPGGTGNGGPGYAIRDELNRRRYGRGMVGMALAGRDTGGSQWFITHSPQPHLDGGYTIFGQVIRGWGALDAIVQGDRILDIEIP